jgi:hypothetical protein
MKTVTTDELLDAISELRSRFPSWRMGQLMANLTMAAGLESADAIWDIEDDRLLAAARRLLERNVDRVDSAE